MVTRYRLTDRGASSEVKNMKGKIVCDGKECATIICKDDGFEVKCTEDGKAMCKEFKGCCD